MPAPIINELLSAYFALETPLGYNVRFPWGTSILSVFKKMKRKVAIVQSNYIPWKGYFEMIAAVDEFILYDDMQYTRRDWRNRNNIKTDQGLSG